MTLKKMEAKINALEDELKQLRKEYRKLRVQQKQKEDPNYTPSLIDMVGEERFRGTDKIKKGFAKFMKEAGIPNEPVGIEELQKRMAKANLEPNELSRGIIEMREE